MEVELRVVLLIVGLVILFVVGMDLIRRRANNQTVAVAKTTILDNDDIDDRVFFDPVVDVKPIPVPKYVREVEQALDPYQNDYMEPAVDLKPVPNNIISITLRSREPYGFRGAALLDAAKSAHLHFGKNNVFYRHLDDAGNDEILFSVVKAVEPGYFYIETLADEYVPGITLILIPEQVDNPQLAFDKFVRIAKQMAFTLNAELLDHKHKPLTLETIDMYSKQAKQK